MSKQGNRNKHGYNGPASQSRPVSNTVFDADFYRKVLPQRVTQACEGKPEAIPVVKLDLANGASLDLCHISYLADSWLAAHYYRDIETCEDMDLAFVPYQLVVLVTVSLHHSTTRRAGFELNRPLGGEARGVPAHDNGHE